MAATDRAIALMRCTAALAALLLAGGCASHAPAAGAPDTPQLVVAPAAAADGNAAGVEAAEAATAVEADAAPAPAADPQVAADAGTDAGAAAPADAAGDAFEDDFAAIYGAEAGTDEGADTSEGFAALDPWEPMNRRVHAFNSAIDRGFMRPVARAYVKVVPGPVRTGVRNFFDNLGAPLAFGNLLLQGRPRESAETLGRFLVNTVFGIGGLFDPATKALKMHRHSADFGRTLARWGWHESRYLELPFLGPRTVRDAVGAVGDVTMAPMTYVEHDRTRLSLEALWLTDTRAGLLSLDDMRESAPDEYVLTRDAWMARRRYLVGADRSARD